MNEYTATARVVAVSPVDRVVTLAREDGTQFEVAAGSGVRNFDQIAVGDAVRVRYRESLVAEKLPPGTVLKPPQGAVEAGTAKPGAKPAAGVGMTVSLPVRIESIDREHDIVVFAPYSGELIARRVQTTKGREFIKTLKVGDSVQLRYDEALALSVEPL